MLPTRTRLLAVALGILAAATPRLTTAQASTPAPDTTTRVPSLAGYAPSHIAAAESLLAAANMEKMLGDMTEQSIQAQIQAMPQMAQFADILREFMKEQMDWKALKPEFVALYVQTFTEPELREVAAFYRTPIGQKMLAKTPELMSRGMALSQRRMQAAMPRMFERIQARAAELQKQGKLTPPDAPPKRP